MEANLEYNSLKIQDKSVKVNVPNNDLARLMYYLRMVSNVLNYKRFYPFTDYTNYNSMSIQDINSIIQLANKFNPEAMMEVGVFVKKEDLDLKNRFIEKTDESMNICADKEIVIGGIVTEALRIMLFRTDWVIYYYYGPKTRLTQRVLYSPILLHQPGVVYQPNNTGKDCLCSCIIF